MPMIGFLPLPAGEDPLAGFPSDGLVALYKMDERTGSKLYDATGTLEPIDLSTGVALDCTTNAQYVVDATSLHTDFNGAAFDAVVGFEIITPALVGTGTTHRIISGTTTSNSPIHIWLAELAYTGSNKFGFGVRTRCSADGGATASRDKNTAITDMPGMLPSTAYQCIVYLYTSGVETRGKFLFRAGTSGPWTSSDGELGSDFTTSCTFVATGAFEVLSAAAGTNAFGGHVSSVFIAKAMPLSDAKSIMDKNASKTHVQNVLADYTSRFWEFREGTGSVAQEWKNDATPTITGTVTWAANLGGISQTAIRQGVGYYGRPGIALGGESGFPAGGGYGTTPVHDSPIIGSADGWSLVVTLRVGNRVPASDQFLFSVYGPQEDGSYSTTPTIQPGVHVVLDDTGLLRGVVKRSSTATGAAQPSGEQALGASPESAANGLFGTYAITCDSTGAISMKRVVTGDTSVTEQATITANVLNHAFRATRVAVGNASFGADVVLGYGAIYARDLTDSEILQVHNMSLSRMRGGELFALAASPGGNGTERYPYSDTLPMVRVHQPNQICNWGTGSYTRFNQSASTTNASSSSNITWRGTGSPTFGPGAALGDYPTILKEGSWSFSGIVWDANDAAYYGMTVSENVESVSFTSCEWKNGHQWVDGVDPEGGSTATGSGITSRAGLTTIINCSATDNDEHGVYLRIFGEDSPDGRCIIDGLTVTGGGEDGLKISTEGAYGAIWDNSLINRVKVTGGLFQLNLTGLKNSTVTNCLLLNQDAGAGPLVCAALLGRADTYDGETLTAKYTFQNTTVANITAVNSTNTAFWVRGSADGSITLANLLASGCASDYENDSTGAVSISHCAGESETNPFPAGTGMIPAATIAFTNAGAGDYTLTEASDGYGDGVNLTGLSDEAEVMFDGATARPATGAWNMGAF